MADIEKKVLNDQDVEEVAGGGASGTFYERNGAIYYTVCSKDTLSEIAWRAQVPMSQILAYNPSIKNPDVISIGQVLRIK